MSELKVIIPEHVRYKGKPKYKYVKAWKQALVSGDYKPNGNPLILRNEHGYSALGVLADVMVKHGEASWHTNDWIGYCMPVRLLKRTGPLSRERLGEHIRFTTNIDFYTESHIIELERKSEFGYSEVTKWLDELYPPIVTGPDGPPGGSMPITAAA